MNWKLKEWTEKWAHLWLQPGDWRAYEDYVTGARTRRFPGAKVSKDVRIVGCKSGVERQIDILVENGERIAFDCKCYKRKVHVKDVEAYLGMLGDIGVARGVLVTTRGYSQGALDRARRDTQDVDLQIMSPERLSEYQHVGAPLIWRGNCGVFLDCPKGWVADTELGGLPGGPLVAMYPLGHALNSAARLATFMYANILTNDAKRPLSELAGVHEKNILASSPGSTFHHTAVRVGDERGQVRDGLLRTATISTQKFGLEHSLYVDYGAHALLIVGLSPPEKAEETINLVTETAKKSFLMVVDDKRTTATSPA